MMPIATSRYTNNVFSYRFILALLYILEITNALSFSYIFKKGTLRLIKNLTNKGSSPRKPFPIRVSWGCNRKCSYCGIKYAVGRFHSKPLKTCYQEFQKGLDLGYKEFEIIADDVGAYGIDVGETIADLLKLLCDSQKDFNILIWNLSPIWLIKYKEDFIPILQKNKIHRIHYPIQSGSSKILKAMNRYNNTDEIINSVLFLKEFCNDLIITTDIIIGYPGETQDDINKTIEIICNSQIDGVGIFKYNDVTNTVASLSMEKIDSRTIKKRAHYVQKKLKEMGIECGVI